MKKVLILGAGMVAKPIIQYLLNSNIIVTVATQIQSDADKLIAGHKNGRSVSWSADDEDTLSKLVAEHNITVSLLPYNFHVNVAKICIQQKRSMLTTSYVKPHMYDLNEKAKEANIIILNELGVDPGIDHMSAMRIIENVHKKGGKIDEFYSFCGALVAPEVEKNPFNYKFTWAPKTVVMAGNNDAKYLRNGEEVYIPSKDIFKDPLIVDFPEIGEIEVYPNRDSLPYIKLYGIPETKTIIRGTFRYKKWCEINIVMKALNLFSYDKINLKDKTYADLMAILINADNSQNIKQKIADYSNISIDSNPIVAMEWIGLFDDKKIGTDEDSPYNITSDLMIKKMMISEEERDMVVMQHTFAASYPDGKKEVIKSRMLDFGSLKTDTSIARTVALPAAVGVKMLLEGKIKATGVHIPVIPEIYKPILDSLEELDIKMVEEYGLPLSENIK